MGTRVPRGAGLLGLHGGSEGSGAGQRSCSLLTPNSCHQNLALRGQMKRAEGSAGPGGGIAPPGSRSPLGCICKRQHFLNTAGTPSTASRAPVSSIWVTESCEKPLSARLSCWQSPEQRCRCLGGRAVGYRSRFQRAVPGECRQGPAAGRAWQNQTKTQSKHAHTKPCEPCRGQLGQEKAAPSSRSSSRAAPRSARHLQERAPGSWAPQQEET